MKLAAISAVIFPLLVMAAWVGRLEWTKHYGAEVILEIQGYDPRDLLSGHYLRYRVNYGPKGNCPDRYQKSSGPVCFCLEKTASEIYEATWAGQCSDRDPNSCGIYIRGNCHYGHFSANIERMYFPERFTKELAVVPPKAVIKVRLSDSGQGQVTHLLVDGVDLIEYARGKQGP